MKSTSWYKVWIKNLIFQIIFEIYLCIIMNTFHVENSILLVKNNDQVIRMKDLSFQNPLFFLIDLSLRKVSEEFCNDIQPFTLKDTNTFVIITTFSYYWCESLLLRDRKHIRLRFKILFVLSTVETPFVNITGRDETISDTSRVPVHNLSEYDATFE